MTEPKTRADEGGTGGGGTRPPEDTTLQHLVHELTTHQVELEAQNQALREAQHALEQARSRYADLYDFAPVAYVTLDERACIQECNLTGASLLKVARAELIGRPFAPFVRKGDVSKFLAHVHDCLATREEHAIEIGLVTALGRPIEVQLRSVVFQEDGPSAEPSPRLCRVAIADITEIGLRAGELRRMERRLADTERLASLGVLAAGTAHEINNPLSFVLLGVDSARATLREWAGEGPAPTEAARIASLDERLSEVQIGCRRIRDIVRSLQSFARPDERAPRRVDVRGALNLAVKMAANEIGHRAHLRIEYAEVPPVLAAESQLGQVFVNLLVNAAQAIPEGAAHRNQIVIRTFAKGGQVVIEVRDTGQGISPDVVGRIFDPFFTTKEVGEGMGLGLSVCHGIVTALGGELTVESTAGEGSVFRVRLPAAPPEDAPAPLARQKREERRLQILVVDDEERFAASLARLLGQDHDASFVTRAAEALERIRGGASYDAIICDVMMPEMTGKDLHEALLDFAPEQAARVVFMTGGDFTEAAHEYLASVPNARIRKPFEPDDLRALLDTLPG